MWKCSAILYCAFQEITSIPYVQQQRQTQRDVILPEKALLGIQIENSAVLKKWQAAICMAVF